MMIHTRTGFMKETLSSAFPFIKIAQFQFSPGLESKLEVLLAKAIHISKTSVYLSFGNITMQPTLKSC